MEKIKYGLKKAYYAKLTFGEDGTTPQYATPIALPGAVSLSLSAQGGSNDFYADDIPYFTTVANSGYSGDLTIARLPDSFRTDILGETLSAESNVMMEAANGENAPFALLFEFTQPSGTPIKHVLYNCTATRPNVDGQTKAETIEPSTDTITIKAIPLPDSELIKAKTTDETPEEVMGGWYTSVWMPTAAAAATEE